MYMNVERKRVIAFGIIALVVLASAGALYEYTRPHPPSNEAQVRSTLYGFGDELRMVSLLGEAGTVAADMDHYYAFYIRPDLLETWKTNPRLAPGRLTSSPWPDRIEIQSLVLNEDGTYTAEVTVVSKVQGAVATSTPMETKARIVLSQGPDGWQISSYEAR